HHDELFLQTYDSLQFKEAFEKRFNDLNEEQKRKQEMFMLQLVGKVNACNTEKELNDLLAIHNDFVLNNDDVKNTFESKRLLLIKQEESHRVADILNKIIQCKTLSELESLDNLSDSIEVGLAFESRKQFLEQQEELRVMREEKEEQDRQQKFKEQEEQKKK